MVRAVSARENPSAYDRVEEVHLANQKLAREGKLRPLDFDPAVPAKRAGIRLKQLLKERRVKQAHVARRLGMAPSVVSRVLKHPERSRLETIRSIAGAAGIPLAELF